MTRFTASPADEHADSVRFTKPDTGAGAVAAARDFAATVIPEGSRRWRHSETCAQAATEAAQVLDPVTGVLLVSAAWLHDIGYHHPAPPTGFHPLDGASLLLDAGWPLRVAALVAHHSHSGIMAAARGLLPEMRRWPSENGLVTDALSWADMTAAPAGGRIAVRERLADIRRRHVADGSAHAAARSRREPRLLLAAARVDVALARAGVRAQLAFPVAGGSSPTLEGTRLLAADHPECVTADLEAALHASAGLLGCRAGRDDVRVLDGAHRLLDAVNRSTAVQPTGGAGRSARH